MWIVTGKSRIHLKLSRDNWSTDKPIVIDVSKRTATITIANGVIDAHTTKLWVEPFGCKPTIRDSKSSIKAKTAPRNMQEYTLPIESPEKVITIKW